MPKRLTTVALAVFYLLQATWLLHAGVDLLLPSVRQAAAAVVDSCCSNACGCPEEVKAAQGCCCIKHAAVQAPETKPARRSAIEEARCKGAEAAMTQAFTQPVLCAFATIDAPIFEGALVRLTPSQPLLPLSSTSIDKVPIA